MEFYIDVDGGSDSDEDDNGWAEATRGAIETRTRTSPSSAAASSPRFPPQKSTLTSVHSLSNVHSGRPTQHEQTSISDHEEDGRYDIQAPSMKRNAVRIRQLDETSYGDRAGDDSDDSSVRKSPIFSSRQTTNAPALYNNLSDGEINGHQDSEARLPPQAVMQLNSTSSLAPHGKTSNSLIQNTATLPFDADGELVVTAVASEGHASQESINAAILPLPSSRVISLEPVPLAAASSSTGTASTMASSLPPSSLPSTPGAPGASMLSDSPLPSAAQKAFASRGDRRAFWTAKSGIASLASSNSPSGRVTPTEDNDL